MLGWVGLPPGTWLSSPDTALGSIVILNVWQQVGYFTVLAVAGLTQIPASLHEAAALDGAGPLRRFIFVTLPLLRRTLLFSAVIAVINAVQVFEFRGRDAVFALVVATMFLPPIVTLI